MKRLLSVFFYINVESHMYKVAKEDKTYFNGRSKKYTKPWSGIIKLVGGYTT